MIWYAFEIVILLFALITCFFVYQALVNSPWFTRLIERTKGTDETNLEDASVRLDVAEKNVDDAMDYSKKQSDKFAEIYGGLKRRRGS